MTLEAAQLADVMSLARRIFSKYSALDTPEVGVRFDAELWDALTRSGLSQLARPERAGGTGALRASYKMLEVAGEFAAPIPLAETDLLGCFLLESADLDADAGPLTTAVGPVDFSAGRLTATFADVPWARNATVVILGETDEDWSVFTGEPTAVHAGHNLAGEPRDALIFESVVARGVKVPNTVAREVRLRSGLARAAQTLGALERAVQLAIDHSIARQQFGRSISKFQAVQMLVAEAAEEAALARAAVEYAVEVIELHGILCDHAELAVAASRACIGSAARIVARNAHQVHGAIGFTLDHQLRHFTLRALAWRNEYGTQRYWEEVVGARAMDAAADAGIWDLISQGRSSESRTVPQSAPQPNRSESI
jgi:acyl-CoA dehydrogenase